MPGGNVEISVPAVEVIIDGTTLSPAAAAHLVEVSVEADTELPDMFSLEIGASDQLGDQFLWVDDASLFSVGNAVEIKMGYADELTSVFKGELTGLEPSFIANRLPTLVVRGYDRRHRLTRGKKTRTFLKQKDSDIASQIASAAGLTASVTNTSVVHEYVLQANQTDYEFLLERAGRIQYEVVVEDKTLYFRPVATEKSAALTLAADTDLAEFRPRLSAAGQVSDVAVRGWDPNGKQAIKGVSSGLNWTMGDKAGGQLSQKAFGEATERLGHLPVLTQDEAGQLATALFEEISLDLITGEAACAGHPELRPGKVVKITGAGERFSGLYYVMAAAHSITANGYTTRFSFRRNAL